MTLAKVRQTLQTMTSAPNEELQARHDLVLDGLLLKQAVGAVDIEYLETVNSLLR